MSEETRQDLLDKYAYLDDLDNRGWAWEFLRRCEEYQSDYLSLQDSKHPEHFANEHKTLAKRWRLKRMMDPCSREIPEFFYEPYENIDDRLWSDPSRWGDLWVEKKLPVFRDDIGKNGIICWDLKILKWKWNKLAELLHPGHMGISQDPGKHPGIDLVKYAYRRFKELQAKYIMIAYSP